jgi:hypothetical protein
MSDTACIVARFEDYESFVEALKSLKSSGKYHYEAYGPTNLSDLEDLMPHQGSGVRIWATAGALIGMVTFWLMCVMSSLIYSIYVGGKPPVSNIPFVIPAYEGTILCGAIGAFIAVAFSVRFSPRKPASPYNLQFSGDSYGVAVYCSAREQAAVAEMLEVRGAVQD